VVGGESPLSCGEGQGERSLFCPFRAQYCIVFVHRALPCAGIFRAFSPIIQIRANSRCHCGLRPPSPAERGRGRGTKKPGTMTGLLISPSTLCSEERVDVIKIH